MGNDRKKQKYFDPLAGKDSVDDTYGAVFVSMLKDKTFQTLSYPARVLYVCCRVQAQSKKGKASLTAHKHSTGEEYDYKTDFVLPASHLCEYGFSPKNATRYFNELIEKGFIERLEDNKHTRGVTVYSFSPKWKGS